MRKYKLAASNIAWDSNSNDVVLEYMRNLGFKGVEIAPTKIVGSNPYGHPKEASDILSPVMDEYGFEICSMQSIWYGRNENIFCPEESKSLVDYTGKAMEFARSIGCRNLVFGCPHNRSMPEGSSRLDARVFFERCAFMAVANGVVLALEANPAIYGTNFLNSTDEVASYLDELGSPKGLGMNLDFGAIVENGESIESVAGYLPRISHVHISEPNLAPIQRRPEHKTLRAILEYGEYDGFVSLEVRNTSPEIVMENMKYIAEVFG